MMQNSGGQNSRCHHHCETSLCIFVVFSRGRFHALKTIPKKRKTEGRKKQIYINAKKHTHNIGRNKTMYDHEWNEVK